MDAAQQRTYIECRPDDRIDDACIEPSAHAVDLRRPIGVAGVGQRHRHELSLIAGSHDGSAGHPLIATQNEHRRIRLAQSRFGSEFAKGGKNKLMSFAHEVPAAQSTLHTSFTT